MFNRKMSKIRDHSITINQTIHKKSQNYNLCNIMIFFSDGKHVSDCLLESVSYFVIVKFIYYE